jgi:hypothetical protein
MQQASRRAVIARGRRSSARETGRTGLTPPERMAKKEKEHETRPHEPVGDMVSALKAGFAKNAPPLRPHSDPRRAKRGDMWQSGVYGDKEHMSPEQVRGEKDKTNPAVPPVPSKKNPRTAAQSAHWMRQAGIPAGVHTTSKGEKVARATSSAWGRSIKPAIKRPRMPGPSRTQTAMRQAGVVPR